MDEIGQPQPPRITEIKLAPSVRQIWLYPDRSPVRRASGKTENATLIRCNLNLPARTLGIEPHLFSVLSTLLRELFAEWIVCIDDRPCVMIGLLELGNGDFFREGLLRIIDRLQISTGLGLAASLLERRAALVRDPDVPGGVGWTEANHRIDTQLAQELLDAFNRALGHEPPPDGNADEGS